MSQSSTAVASARISNDNQNSLPGQRSGGIFTGALKASALLLDDSSDDSADEFLSAVGAATEKDRTNTGRNAMPKERALTSTKPRSKTRQTTSSSVALPLPTETTQSHQAQDRARKRQEAQELARIEKEERQRKRERDRQQKREQKEMESQAKKLQTQQFQQETGKFSHKEVVLLLDPSIYGNSSYGIMEALEDDFLIEEYPSILPFDKAAQWIRKEHMQGGATEAWKCLQQRKRDSFEHLPYLLLVLEPDDYIPLIQRQRHEEDDNYPALGKWLEALKSRWKLIWDTTKEPRIFLLLHNISADLDRRWVDHRRGSDHNNTRLSPPTEWEFQDSIHWLLIQFQVECIQCKTIEQIQANFHGLTRMIAEEPYVRQVTELECVRKIKQGIGVEDDALSKSRDTWLRQLQMIPKLSESRARSVVQHYPTMHSLWQAYRENAQDKSFCDNLLNHSFGSKGAQPLLSSVIHKVLTSDNPDEMI